MALADSDSTASIFVAGDFCPQNRISQLQEVDPKVLFSPQLRDVISNSNYAIVNLEAPIWGQGCKKIKKSGPNLICSEKSINTLKANSFTCVTLANNHIMDYGEEGLNNTISALNNEGIEYVGVGKNSRVALEPLLKNINGISMAFINCCEYEFCIAGNDSAGAYHLDISRLYYQLQELKNKVQYTFVIIHGGVEHHRYPTPRMQRLYRLIIDAGASVVINHHQHCYCGYEKYHNHYIFYGLGNFCFDCGPRNQEWHEGFALLFHLSPKTLTYEFLPILQCKEKPLVELLSGDEKERFNAELAEISKAIIDNDELYKELVLFSQKKKREFDYYFSPYNNRFLSALYVRGFLPDLFSKSRWFNILNAIRCESHRERLINYIESKCYE